MKPVTILFAKDVPAYASTTVQIPDDMPLAQFIEDQAFDLMSDLVFSPDWQQADSDRIVDASDGAEMINDVPMNTTPAQSKDQEIQALLLDIEQKIMDLRSMIDDPIEINLGGNVAIEVVRADEGDSLIVSRNDWGYTKINYSADALRLYVYDASYSLEPIHEEAFHYSVLLDENAGLSKSFPAE